MALRNLINNAIRYTGEGGILLGCRRRGRHLLIQVWDTGIGIPAGELSTIFQEFYQIGNTARDRRKGLGLGLAIVKRIAALLGHPLSVRSTVGKGSVFDILVPLADEAPPLFVVETGTHLAVPMGALMVVIDDDPDVLNALTVLLKHSGCRVLAAASSQEALAQLQQTPQLPDAIIADYRLQKEETGCDAIHAIRQALNASIPALLITGDTSPERLQEANNSGLRLLHKPVGAEELHAALAKVLVGSGA